MVCAENEEDEGGFGFSLLYEFYILYIKIKLILLPNYYDLEYKILSFLSHQEIVISTI